MDNYDIVLRRVNEPDVDLTEHVRRMFDLVVQSMDWGSGMLETDDMAQVIEVGAAMRIADDDMLDLLAEQRAMQRQYAVHDFDPDRDLRPGGRPPQLCKICGEYQGMCEYKSKGQV